MAILENDDPLDNVYEEFIIDDVLLSESLPFLKII